MGESKCAGTLRQLGFVESPELSVYTKRIMAQGEAIHRQAENLAGMKILISAPQPRFTRWPENPFTVAVDETGSVWIIKKIVDLSRYGFVEIGKDTKN